MAFSERLMLIDKTESAKPNDTMELYRRSPFIPTISRRIPDKYHFSFPFHLVSSMAMAFSISA
jgi:hypothetical protein